MTCRKEAGSERAILRAIRKTPGRSMIICSCNVLSDQDVRAAVHNVAPRTTYQVYGCLGCSAQCGRCARTIRKIMDEAAAGTGAHPAKSSEVSSALPQSSSPLRSVA